MGAAGQRAAPQAQAMLQDEEFRQALEDLLVQRARGTAREVAALLARRQAQTPLLGSAGAIEAGEDQQLRRILKHAYEIRQKVNAGPAEAPPSPPSRSKSSVGNQKEHVCNVLAIFRGARRCAAAVAAGTREGGGRPDLAAPGSAVGVGAAEPPRTAPARAGLSPAATVQGPGPQQDSLSAPQLAHRERPDRAPALGYPSSPSAGADPPSTGASMRPPASPPARTRRLDAEEGRLRGAGSPPRHPEQLLANVDRLGDFAQQLMSAKIISGGRGDPAY